MRYAASFRYHVISEAILDTGVAVAKTKSATRAKSPSQIPESIGGLAIEANKMRNIRSTEDAAPIRARRIIATQVYRCLSEWTFASFALIGREHLGASRNGLHLNWLRSSIGPGCNNGGPGSRHLSKLPDRRVKSGGKTDPTGKVQPADLRRAETLRQSVTGLIRWKFVNNGPKRTHLNQLWSIRAQKVGQARQRFSIPRESLP